jgi:drug/metabolite transporter (DMT)-like permease
MTRRQVSKARSSHAERLSLLLGFIGVVVFSLTLPVTRRAVMELPAEFVGFGRIALAGLASVPTLVLLRAPLPRRQELPIFAMVIGGVVFGFPVLTTLALQHVHASHGAVVLGVLPLLTAAAAAIIGGERPRPAFWFYALLGGLTVMAFALLRSQGGLAAADFLLLIACGLSAMGYAAGAVLARSMPGIAVIAWALVVSMPLAALIAALHLPALPAAVSWTAWSAFLYVALGSQFLGFLFWYKGLAMGGIARVGQIQLLQTFLTLAFSALLLGEDLDLLTWFFAALTVAIVWLGRKARVDAPVRLPLSGLG